MADLKFGGICLLYITLSLISISGLIWLTQFSFNAKVSSVSAKFKDVNIKVTEVENVDISDNNLTGSKIAIVSIWIQIFVSLAFVIYKLYKHVR
jgi:hypothetical protein